MKVIAIGLFAAAAMSAQAAPKPGDRTIPVADLLAQMGEGLSDAELQRAARAASAHPLGTLDNPVRTAGPEGERAYLARLRCSDGSAPQVGRRTDGGVGAYGSLTSAYAIDCGTASPGKMQIVIDMYHDGFEETAAPAGMTRVGR